MIYLEIKKLLKHGDGKEAILKLAEEIDEIKSQLNVQESQNDIKT